MNADSPEAVSWTKAWLRLRAGAREAKIDQMLVFTGSWFMSRNSREERDSNQQNEFFYSVVQGSSAICGWARPVQG
jgi:hypothetical protein